MAKEKKFLLIEEETLREMLQTRFQQTYALVLLSHICMKHNLDTSLTMAEISGVLQLSSRQVTMPASAVSSGSSESATDGCTVPTI